MLVAAAVGALIGSALVPLVRVWMTSPQRLGVRGRIGGGIATASLFALVAFRVGWDPALLPYTAFAAAAVALSLVDLAERRLPDRMVLPSAVGVGGLLVAAALLEGRPYGAVGVPAGAAGLFAVYLLLALPMRGALGMGDVKLALLVGAAAGFLGMRAWLLALVAGFLVNGAVTLLALVTRRTSWGGSVPFGPSMLAGAFLALVLA
ncbi:MAG: prepilin peptidase [Amnibacterium sp.]